MGRGFMTTVVETPYMLQYRRCDAPDDFEQSLRKALEDLLPHLVNENGINAGNVEMLLHEKVTICAQNSHPDFRCT